MTGKRLIESYTPGRLAPAVERDLRTMVLEAVAEVVAEQDEELPPEDEEILGEQVAPLGDEEELPDVESIVNSILEQAADVQDELDEELPVGEMDDLEEEPIGEMDEELPDEFVESFARRGSPILEGRLSAVETRLQLERSGRILEGAIKQARLPGPLATVVRNQFAGRVFEYGELADMIKSVREAAISMDQSGRVTGSGLARSGRVQMGMTGLEFHRLRSPKPSAD